jgi:diadenosine tetraphosphatase ApaH/serine/threonine PP2A family protein phosphatase
VYAVLRDVARAPEWRKEVKRVDLVGEGQFREVGANGTILYQIDEDRPPQRLVTRIADEALPFGGTWTYELAPCPEGTEVRITERGEVRNPVFRALARFVFGHTATMERYLASLRARQERPDR